ncbi:MAG: protease, partial [Bacteroidetes bacterium]|nr:protease [Bacteroidota bacterium]
VEQESTEKETGKKEEKDKKEEPSKASKDLVVDMDGIIGRIVSLPIDPGAYRGINAIGEQVYYLRNAAKDEKTLLLLYDLKEKKETELGSVDNYEITADKRKMLVASSRKYAVIDLPKGKVDIKDFIDLGNMKMMVDVKAEWNQIYNEAWRQMKYFFYDANMHGVNWDNIREKYKPLLGYVSNRNDLNYILGEMVGELNVGHAYVGGGDKVEPRKIKMGLLGAEITRDASGFFRIDRILPGENWTSVARSPLTEVGVDVKEGDYIIAINRKPVKGVIDLYELLIGTAGNQVELTVNTQPQEAGARKVIVVPVDDESGLYYYNWVQNNMKKVSEASNGQIGYIHIPDMGPEGLNEFVKHFYPQLRKKALIIDDRGNGGGNVSSMIIERLRRELVFMEVARNTTTDHAGPALHYGPKAVLIDQYSASDGDLFPYQFKSLKLGKTIGVRTWGGVVGIRGSLPFIDGGSLMKPEFAHFDKEGKEFVIEGKGVEPDIRVVNDPAKEYAGEDQQLNKAIEVLLEELKNNPKQLPDAPPYPDKTR